MLRIWQMSGQELPTASMDEISDVLSLKTSLRSRHGFPLCMQQLLCNGNSLDNSTKLEAPIDLQLVLLTLSKEVLQVEAAKELAEVCLQGGLTTARLLLEAGVNQDAKNDEGHTALMLAAGNGHVEMARLLLAAGADKDLQNRFGNTALMRAAENGHVEIARLLLEAGADRGLDLHNRFGNTALMLAAGNGHVEMARLLLEAGADQDRLGQAGYTALQLTAKNCHLDIARLLLGAAPYPNLASRSGSGYTALMLAAANGHVDIGRLL